MTPQRFDGFVQTLGATVSRRRTLAALLVGLTGLVPLFGEAKKKHNNKKKCKRPKVKCKKKCCAAGQVCSGGKCTTPPPPPVEECQFTKTATLWTLQGDCTITKTIEIPDGVTLEGNGKTITMSGAVANYLKNVPDDWAVAAGVLANGGSANVHDLTIRGNGLSGSCDPTGPEGLAFINTSGTIENVTVEDIALASGSCGFGITATGTGGQTVTIEDVTVDGVGVLGLTRLNTDGITVNLDGATVTNDGGLGVWFQGGRVSGTIANVSISGLAGISVFGRGDMDGTSVEISDVVITSSLGHGIEAVWIPDGVEESGTFSINVTRADITCTGEPEIDFQAGIYYSLPNADFSSTVDDSEIRGGLFGVWQDGANFIAVQNSTIEESLIGAGNWGGTLLVDNNAFTGVRYGVDAFRFGSLETDSTVTNNAIQGGTATAESSFGVSFGGGATGTASGNEISNFFDTDISKPSCGIGVFESAGEVTIDDNTFPDPPGNEQNICLDVPVPPAPRAKGKRNETFGIEALRHMRERRNVLSASDHAGRDRRRSKQKNKGGRAHQKRGDKR